MNQKPNIKALRSGLGISQGELAEALKVSQPAVAWVENNSAIPRKGTVSRWLEAFNVILAGRGSDRRISYDEIWAAFCVGRLHALPPASPAPDLTPGLRALGDLPAVDQSTAAPTAQGA